MVESAGLIEGRCYGYREGRRPDTPLIKIKLLAKVGRGGKLKIRWEEGPHPGLEEYIHCSKLVVSWGERRAFLRDEERLARLEEYSVKEGDRTVAEAVGTVLASSGEPSAYATIEGLSMPEAEIERIVRRAGLDDRLDSLHPLGFVDRHREVHLPLDAAERIARAFAAAEPESVLMAIQEHEDELRSRRYAPGERHLHGLLRQYAPAYALARQWCGIEREVELLQKEIGRLRSIISRAAYDLKALGAERKARSLLRAMDGG